MRKISGKELVNISKKTDFANFISNQDGIQVIPNVKPGGDVIGIDPGGGGDGEVEQEIMPCLDPCIHGGDGWCCCPLGAECFVAGTKIIMKDGPDKNIEDVEIGDEVLSYNIHTEEFEPKHVTQLYTQTHDLKDGDTTVKVTFDNGTITHNTIANPFWSRDKGFVAVDADRCNTIHEWVKNSNHGKDTETLEIGDVLFVYDNDKLEEVKVVDIEVILEPDIRTYDIEVKDNHTFFADGILTHNSDGGGYQCSPPIIIGCGDDSNACGVNCFQAGLNYNCGDGGDPNCSPTRCGECGTGASCKTPSYRCQCDDVFHPGTDYANGITWRGQRYKDSVCTYYHFHDSDYGVCNTTSCSCYYYSADSGLSPVDNPTCCLYSQRLCDGTCPGDCTTANGCTQQAYLNECNICVGGFTGFTDNQGVDDCNKCPGEEGYGYGPETEWCADEDNDGLIDPSTATAGCYPEDIIDVSPYDGPNVDWYVCTEAEIDEQPYCESNYYCGITCCDVSGVHCCGNECCEVGATICNNNNQCCDPGVTTLDVNGNCCPPDAELLDFYGTCSFFSDVDVCGINEGNNQADKGNAVYSGIEIVNELFWNQDEYIIEIKFRPDPASDLTPFNNWSNLLPGDYLLLWQYASTGHCSQQEIGSYGTPTEPIPWIQWNVAEGTSVQGYPGDIDWLNLDNMFTSEDAWIQAEGYEETDQIGQVVVAGLCTEMVIIQEVIPHENDPSRTYVKILRPFEELRREAVEYWYGGNFVDGAFAFGRDSEPESDQDIKTAFGYYFNWELSGDNIECNQCNNLTPNPCQDGWEISYANDAIVNYTDENSGLIESVILNPGSTVASIVKYNSQQPVGKIVHYIDTSDAIFGLLSEYCNVYHPTDESGLDPDLCYVAGGYSNLKTYDYEDVSPLYLGGGVYYSSVQYTLGTNGFYGFGD